MILLLAAAHAADATGVRLDTPSPGPGLTVPALADTPGNLDVAVMGGWVGTSAVATYSDGEREVLLADTIVLDTSVAYVATRQLRLELGLPIVATAGVGEASGGLGGDLWLGGSYTILNTDALAIAPRLGLSVPVSPWGPLTTRGGVAGAVSVVAHAQLAGFRFGANVGLALEPESPLGTDATLAASSGGATHLPMGVAVSRRVAGPLSLGLELAGAAFLFPAVATDSGPAWVPVDEGGGELLAHVALNLRRVELVGGYGVGLGVGLGVPESHAFLGVRGRVLEGQTAPEDRDADGLADADDRCPDQPEDKDGFQDRDGCPDDDDDRDGLADAADTCPQDPEDRDRFEDQDGCPEPDNDRDGLSDGADDCPLEPGPPATRGCPPPPGRVRVTDARIEIDDRVYFDTGRASIQEVSLPLLREVAAAANAAPDVLLIQVAGHTDSEGVDSANLALSQARADAVRLYLITYGGVDPARLEARGFGETMPVASNDTEDGRAQNRRVEFVIVRRR